MQQARQVLRVVQSDRFRAAVMASAVGALADAPGELIPRQELTPQQTLALAAGTTFLAPTAAIGVRWRRVSTPRSGRRSRR